MKFGKSLNRQPPPLNSNARCKTYKVKASYFYLNVRFCSINISHYDVFEVYLPEQARELLFVLVMPAETITVLFHVSMYFCLFMGFSIWLCSPLFHRIHRSQQYVEDTAGMSKHTLKRHITPTTSNNTQPT